MLATPERYKIQYYFVTDDGLFRLSGRLHRDLLSGETALVQFADTRQKLIELIIPQSGWHGATARGIIYIFDANGFLDLRRKVRDAMPVMPRYLHDKTVTDLTPAIAERSFRKSSTWQPPQAMLDLIIDATEGGPLKPRKIKNFKPS